MRLVTCALALCLALTTLTTQIAAACGGYGMTRRAPEVMFVSTHGLEKPRAFVVTGNRTASETDRWELLAPRSYDYTKIMQVYASGQPVPLTLVGPSGREQVLGFKRVALSGALWVHDSTVDAIEVPAAKRGDFKIALRGNVKDATWHDAVYLGDGVLDLGGGVTAKTAHTGSEPRYELFIDGISLGTHAGYVEGVLSTNGSRYAVMKNGTAATTVAI